MAKESPVKSEHSSLGFLIGNHIKTFRKQIKLRQVELATAVGLSNRHLQKIESGKVDIKSSTIATFSEPLGVPPCYLVRDVTKASLQHLGLVCTNDILNAIHLGIQISDLAGRIYYANKAHRETLGLQKDYLEAPIYIWDRLQDQSEIPKLKEYLKFLVENTPEPTPYYTKNISATGVVVPLKIDWNYLRDEKQKVIGFLSVITTNPCW